MEETVFDDVMLENAVNGLKNAGADPVPSRDAIQLGVFSSGLEDFDLLLSVGATHISHGDRFNIRFQVAQAKKKVGLLRSSGRIWPVEIWYREIFEQVRKQAKWLEDH